MVTLVEENRIVALVGAEAEELNVSVQSKKGRGSLDSSMDGGGLKQPSLSKRSTLA